MRKGLMCHRSMSRGEERGGTANVVVLACIVRGRMGMAMAMAMAREVGLLLSHGLDIYDVYRTFSNEVALAS